MNKKGLILVTIGVLLIVFGFINPLRLGVKEAETDNKKEEKKEEKSSNFNGLYYLDEYILKIYTTEKDKLRFNFSKDNTQVFSNIADISNNTATYSMLDEKYTFTLTDKGIKVETNDDTVKSGEYIKNKDYTINDFYQDNYGDLTYVNGDITGIYELNNVEIYVLQRSELGISFTFNYNDKTVLADSTIDSGVYNVTILEDKYSLKFEKDKLIFTSNNDKLSGTYNKKKGLTVEEIIQKF